MQPDRFTIKSQEALAGAARLAQDRANPQITPAHLLSVLLDGDGGTAGASPPGAGAAGAGAGAGGVVLPVLAKLGVQLPALRAESERALDELPRLTPRLD